MFHVTLLSDHCSLFLSLQFVSCSSCCYIAVNSAAVENLQIMKFKYHELCKDIIVKTYFCYFNHTIDKNYLSHACRFARYADRSTTIWSNFDFPSGNALLCHIATSILFQGKWVVKCWDNCSRHQQVWDGALFWQDHIYRDVWGMIQFGVLLCFQYSSRQMIVCHGPLYRTWKTTSHFLRRYPGGWKRTAYYLFTSSATKHFHIILR